VELRNVLTFAEEIASEADCLGDPLLRKVAVIAAFANRDRLHHRVGGLAAEQIKGADGRV
jgi:hypothetical protein